jgi:hypothetical protein
LTVFKKLNLKISNIKIPAKRIHRSPPIPRDHGGFSISRLSYFDF